MAMTYSCARVCGQGECTCARAPNTVPHWHVPAARPHGTGWRHRSCPEGPKAPEAVQWHAGSPC
eukprot:2676-Eustigmatos_ZCMA.PRE.1